MGFIADIGSLGESIFGSDKEKSSFGTENVDRFAEISKTGSSQLKLDPKAIQKIIRDVFGAEGGLADIFGEEQTAGIFNSSVVKGQVRNLTSDIIGELAKITGETVTAEDQTESEQQRTVSTNQESESTAGLLEASGLSGISAKLDPTGLVQKIRDEKFPSKQKVEDLKKADAAARSVDKELEDKFTPQAIKDIESTISGFDREGEIAIADQLLALIG